MPKTIPVSEFRDLISDIQDQKIIITKMFYKESQIKVFHEENGALFGSHIDRIYHADLMDGKSIMFRPDDMIDLYFAEDGDNTREEIRDLTPEEVDEIIKKRKETTASTPSEGQEPEVVIPKPEEEEEIY